MVFELLDFFEWCALWDWCGCEFVFEEPFFDCVWVCVECVCDCG